MKLLVIILLIMVYRNWSGGNPVSERLSSVSWYQWLSRQDRLAAQSEWITMGLFVAVPLVLIYLITGIFADWLTLFLLHLISLGLLIYSLGDWEAINELMDKPLETENGESAERMIEKGQSIQEEVLEARFHSFFAPVLWYLILGPLGLIFYFLFAEYCRLQEDGSEGSSMEVLYYLEWIPARLTALMFSITGNFADTFSEWMDSLFNHTEPHLQVLMRSARTAISVRTPDPSRSEDLEEDIEMEVEEFVLLLDRTIWAFVGLAALATIVWF